MDAEDCLDDSQDIESFHDEEGLLPEMLDDEYTQLSQKSTNIIKFLHTTGEFELSTDVQKLFTTYQRLRKDNFAKTQEIAGMVSESHTSKQRIAEALIRSKIDNANMQTLKLNTEDAWKRIDAAQDREQHAQEKFYRIREKMENLEAENKKMAGCKEGGDALLSYIASHKHELLKERHRLTAEVDELNRRLQIQRIYTEKIERQRSEVEAKNKELHKLLDDVSGEAFEEKLEIDSLKERLAIVTADNSTMVKEIKKLKLQSDTFVKSNTQQNLQISALKSNLERANTQANIATGKLAKYSSDIEQLSQTMEKLKHDLNQKITLLKLKDDEAVKYRNESSKMEKLRDNLVRKLQISEEAKNAIETELTTLKNQASTHNKEQSDYVKFKEETDKKLQLITRDRNSLQNEVLLLQRKIAEREEDTLMANNEIKSLKEVIKQKNIAEQKLKAFISKIDVERDRNAEETQILEDKIDSLNDEVHLKEDYIFKLKESTNELNTSLAKTRFLFETARTERNNCERNLDSSFQEKNVLKTKYMLSNQKIEQLKEVMKNKELKLSRTHANLEKLERDCQKTRIEFRNLEVILQNTRSELKEKKIENKRLYTALSDNEFHFGKIRREFDNALHEKDLIGTQLMKRNDEISVVLEKMQIMQLALDRGEKQYAERSEDIRLLKIEIANLKSQRNVLTRGLANTSDMRQEVLQLHRVLNQERFKARVLQEEMLTPMNIHRWRTLSGKDPERMALITKIQSLQKRILCQAVIATERESSLQAAHRLYNTLKEFMLKLPSYKVKERLVETQHALVAKEKKLRALTAELNAKETDDKSKECVVEVLQINLESTKKELIREKKCKQKLIKEREIINQIHSYSAPTPCVRTLGSGFKMTLNT